FHETACPRGIRQIVEGADLYGENPTNIHRGGTYDFKSDASYAPGCDAQPACGGVRQVNDPFRYKWPAVVDADINTAARIDTVYVHPRPKPQCSMSSRKLLHVVHLPT